MSVPGTPERPVVLEAKVTADVTVHVPTHQGNNLRDAIEGAISWQPPIDIDARVVAITDLDIHQVYKIEDYTADVEAGDSA